MHLSSQRRIRIPAAMRRLLSIGTDTSGEKSFRTISIFFIVSRKICDKYRVTDAQAFLLEKTGAVQEAFDLMLDVHLKIRT